MATSVDSTDHCYAKLIEMFGESIEMETIFDVGQKFQWNFSQCVELLLKCSTDKEEEKRTPSTSRSSHQQQQDTSTAPISFSDRLKLGLGPSAFAEHVSADRPEKSSHLDKLYNQIADGYKILLLMRGLPGSGKSTLARKLLQKASLDPNQHIVSADDYFTDRFGNYNYDRSKLSDAHQDCQQRAKSMMMRNFAPIVIDNTNIRLWEMEVFCVNAVDHGYIVKILEPTTWWAKNPEECTRRNSHSVPMDTIFNMKRNYERIQNGQELLEIFHLPKRIQYQLRELPPIVRTPDVEPEPDVIKSFSPIQSTDDVVIDSEEIVKPNPFENFNWTAHEREVNSFWEENILPRRSVIDDSSERKGSGAKKSHSTPKQREKAGDVSKSLFDQMLSALRDNENTAGGSEDNSSQGMEGKVDQTNAIEKHRKGCANENDAFADVRLAFPTVSIQYLWDLFEKCNGDANWMMNILLNENLETDSIPGDTDEDFQCNCESSGWGTSPECEEEGAVAVDRQSGKAAQPQRQKKRTFNPRMFDLEAEQMKRQIEESVCIGDEFYTENMKRVREWKNKKRGERQSQQEASQFQEESERSSVNATEEDEDDYDGDSSDEDLFEFRLGSEFINQLEALFNSNSEGLDFHKFRPNVYMTKTLAKQIYHLWVESMMYQLEEQKTEAMKDDEEIARQIGMEEKKSAVRFSDVTQMACAMHAYTTSDNEWVKGTDLAVKLKRQKLYEIFPNIQKSTIDEILEQNNENYDRVVDTLTESFPQNTDERLAEQQNKLILAAKYESEKIPKQTKIRTASKPLSSGDAKRDALRDFEENRNKAMHHHQLRMECFQKAQDSQKRNSEVAYYYLQIAKLHQSKVDYYNHLAANSIVNVHDLTHNNAELLDLHYLLVQEAIPCLEVFLDSHIMRMRRNKLPYKHIFLITGRGLHSAGGIPTIKMNVKNYLTKRGLRCIEVNPGLLRVKIYNNSATTGSV